MFLPVKIFCISEIFIELSPGIAGTPLMKNSFFFFLGVGENVKFKNSESAFNAFKVFVSLYFIVISGI
jgi:hypothetical protein